MPLPVGARFVCRHPQPSTSPNLRVSLKKTPLISPELGGLGRESIRIYRRRLPASSVQLVRGKYIVCGLLPGCCSSSLLCLLLQNEGLDSPFLPELLFPTPTPGCGAHSVGAHCSATAEVGATCRYGAGGKVGGRGAAVEGAACACGTVRDVAQGPMAWISA